MSNKEKKYITDFFVIRKKYHWFLLPTPILYYRKDTFFETGATSPSWGLTLRFLIFMVGIQIQKNIYYKIDLYSLNFFKCFIYRGNKVGFMNFLYKCIKIKIMNI